MDMETEIQLEALLSMLTPEQFEALASSLSAQGLADDLVEGDIGPETLQVIAEEVWQILEGAGEA
jgi:hypothetical protein